MSAQRKMPNSPLRMLTAARRQHRQCVYLHAGQPVITRDRLNDVAKGQRIDGSMQLC